VSAVCPSINVYLMDKTKPGKQEFGLRPIRVKGRKIPKHTIRQLDYLDELPPWIRRELKDAGVKRPPT
jgi:hypothetical protein